MLALYSTAASSQSFNCSRSATSDEVMVCQNVILSRLDEELADEFSKLRRRLTGFRREQLDREQREWLSRRRACRVDTACIRQVYEVRMKQLEDYSADPTKGKKILLSSHVGSATVISLTGVNSEHARVTFRRELDDAIEDCARNMGLGQNDDVDASKVSRCAVKELAEQKGRIDKRSANCPRNTIYTEFGNYSLVNWEKEPESSIEGKPYRPMRTDWKDHRNEQIIGNCSGCGTPQIMDTFQILCPRTYHNLFDGYDAY